MISREESLAMGSLIPLMIEDLKACRHEYYYRFKVRWDEYCKKGCTQRDIYELYLGIKGVLPEGFKNKY